MDWERFRIDNYDSCNSCDEYSACDEECDDGVCKECMSQNEPENEYRIVTPFNVVDLWGVSGNKTIYNLLVDLNKEEWEDWHVSEKFTGFFNEDDVPPTLWRERYVLVHNGFIEKIKPTVLKQGMKLDAEYEYLGDDEFVVVRIGTDELTLISTKDWNRWSNVTLVDGSTLESLNKISKHINFTVRDD